mgnify:FL=1|jgi:D-arabinose 1-dehydrogenase-like Zn-dependent alcohol dehydrogenase
MHSCGADQTNSQRVIENARLSDLQSGDVFVRVYASGFCHTELALIHHCSDQPSRLIPAANHRFQGFVLAI